LTDLHGPATMPVMNVAWFVPIGFLVGTYGTLIGAGGGFIIVPLLMLLFPQDAPSMITAASLAVIFVNSTSGTIAYARMRRISYRTGLLFAVATIPGGFLGSWLTQFIPRREFGLVFGILLAIVAVFVALTRGRSRAAKAAPGAAVRPPLGAGRGRLQVLDTVVERDGRTHQLSFNPLLGVGLSLLVGCFSSLVGIGGGLIHVPLLTSLFGFPLHVATATSHFILVFTSLAGVVEHILDGTWPVHLLRDACLALGVVGGAQVGAFLSRRLATRWIVIGLSAALGLVGLRLVVMAFMG
jgi:uncharacterized membrane protein YfcA